MYIYILAISIYFIRNGRALKVGKTPLSNAPPWGIMKGRERSPEDRAKERVMSDLKEVNIPLAAADAEKSESLPDRKEDFAFLKLKKELKSLKFENSELRAQLGVFKDQQTEQTFLAHGGRKNAFQAFKKANADLLADPDQPID